ncbi:MAG TPA: transaldolase [Solirubrobacteraceae bacterium]|jgi:transaldolase|nr:transaldolase [Solirubrobacteraceae bacterium]
MPTPSPLQSLSALGQSVWIDFLSREAIRGGHLKQLIDQYAVVGATSNPTIFQKAMGSGNAYDEQLQELGTNDVEQAFWALAEQDIREACDLFRPIWEEGLGRDGYVSLEVDPRLAYDSLGTFNEAIRLHKDVDRPNLLVKIPATKPGLAAIEDVIAKGHSVNITLIFSLKRYAEVAESYIRGLERLVAEGGDPSKVASVASFFVSRIDTEGDRLLDEIAAHDGSDGAARAGSAHAGSGAAGLKGRLAIANAKLAYRHYQQTFQGSRWTYLAGKGATPQRVLWASTSTKNPAYPDTLYVDELIGPDTVNTMPEETVLAFQEHGTPRATLAEGLDEAQAVLDDLASVGVDYDELTETVEREGVEKFEASFTELLDSLKAKLGTLAPA